MQPVRSSSCGPTKTVLQNYAWHHICWRVLIPTAFVLLVWSALALVVSWWRSVPFPSPVSTALQLWSLIQGTPLLEYSVYTHMAVSLRRWALGYALAVVVGVGYGLIAGRWPVLARLTSGIPRLLLLIPGLAWIPVSILLFGVGETATVSMIFLTAFAPIAINVCSGLANVDQNLIRAARMLGAGPSTLFFKVLLPAALPAILCGLRLGLGTAWRVLVAAEMVIGTGQGLGYAIIQARWNLDYTSSFACIALICALGVILEYLFLGSLEQKTLQRWTPRKGQ